MWLKAKGGGGGLPKVNKKLEGEAKLITNPPPSSSNTLSKEKNVTLDT